MRPADSRVGSGCVLGLEVPDLDLLLDRLRSFLAASSSSFFALFFSYRPATAALPSPAARIGSDFLNLLRDRERSPFRERDLLLAFSTNSATAAPANPASAMRLLRWEEL